ncbi:MAG: hypothetical protein GXY77_18755 [Fibrobacter sp.]|nr:hypothetical protein [Fibrobacter sp.]
MTHAQCGTFIGILLGLMIVSCEKSGKNYNILKEEYKNAGVNFIVTDTGNRDAKNSKGAIQKRYNVDDVKTMLHNLYTLNNIENISKYSNLCKYIEERMTNNFQSVNLREVIRHLGVTKLVMESYYQMSPDMLLSILDIGAVVKLSDEVIHSMVVTVDDLESKKIRYDVDGVKASCSICVKSYQNEDDNTPPIKEQTFTLDIKIGAYGEKDIRDIRKVKCDNLIDADELSIFLVTKNDKPTPLFLKTFDCLYRMDVLNGLLEDYEKRHVETANKYDNEKQKLLKSLISEMSSKNLISVEKKVNRLFGQEKHNLMLAHIMLDALAFFHYQVYEKNSERELSEISKKIRIGLSDFDDKNQRKTLPVEVIDLLYSADSLNRNYREAGEVIKTNIKMEQMMLDVSDRL